MLNRYDNTWGYFHINYVTALFKVLGSELTIFECNVNSDHVFRFEFAKNNANDLMFQVIHFLFQSDIYLEDDKYVFFIDKRELVEKIVFFQVKKALKAVGLPTALSCKAHSHQYLRIKEGTEDKDFESKLGMIGGEVKKNYNNGIVELCFKNPTKFIEATFPLELARWQEIAFLMGNKERLGKGSPIWKSFFNDPDFDCNLLPTIFAFLPEPLSQSESKQSFDVGDSKPSAQLVETYRGNIKPLNEKKYGEFFRKIEERIQSIIEQTKKKNNEMTIDNIQEGEYSEYKRISKDKKREFEEKKEAVHAKHKKYQLEIKRMDREKEYLMLILSEKRFFNPELTLTECVKLAREAVSWRFPGAIELPSDIITLVTKDIPNFDDEDYVNSCFSEVTKMIENAGPASESKANFQSLIEQLENQMNQKPLSDRMQLAEALKEYVNNIINNCDGANRDKRFKKFSNEFRSNVRIIERDVVIRALLGAVISAAAAFFLTLIPGATLAHSYTTVGVSALFGLGIGLYAANKSVVKKLISEEVSSELINAGRSLVVG